MSYIIRTALFFIECNIGLHVESNASIAHAHWLNNEKERSRHANDVLKV